MTLWHPESRDREAPERAQCAECGSDSFHFDAIDARGACRIVGLHCAVCGDYTPFELAPPELHN